jgi:light-regulated signal transduction histidine kinase (bacteriophytochrome)
VSKQYPDEHPGPAQAAEAGADAALGVPPSWWSRLGHDLRGPLGPMRMAVQLLRSGRGSGDEQREALQVLDRQIDRLLSEIDDAADLVRARNGIALVRPRPGDLHLVLDAVSGRVGLLRCLAERGQTLDCVPADRDVQADHDPSRLCAVLDFLLRQSATHAGNGAAVELALVDADGGEAAFQIRGFGAGLFEDADMAWMLGRAVVDVDQLTPRAVLMRELIRQAGARLETDPAQSRLTLLLPRSRQA